MNGFEELGVGHRIPFAGRGRVEVAQVPACVLPRAGWFTDALIAPAEGIVTATELSSLRAQLIFELVRRNRADPEGSGDIGLMSHSSGRGVRIDAHMLRSVDLGAAPVVEEAPFRWTASTARRSIGLAAFGLWRRGRARSLPVAVMMVMEGLVEEARAGHVRSGSVEEWMGGLGEGGRAAVGAQAVTWSTRLASAVEWHRVDGHVWLGNRYQWWDIPGSVAGADPSGNLRGGGVSLRGRADVHLMIRARDADSAEGSRGHEVHLSVFPGSPTASSVVELGISALVSAMALGAERTPVRVAGWWPDSGKAQVIAVDAALLARTSAGILDALAALDRRLESSRSAA